MRDAVAAESQKLDQEAEENSKLREFLMDRGHVVDALQGEIAIVCEDILSLKQRVEGRIPLTKSLMSSSSFTKPPLLLSSSSSSGSSVKSSEHGNRETPLLSNQEEEKATVFLSKLAARSNPLDDWEFM
ncbi:uncharacterized protein LOC110034598 [Phalaenopsis equestris]|uniref:uncharacterized protein LOC110034598 n=1 Tax=Phalaenopsis equestris TaxID=78828 RepID=UPI0009E5E94C|nr:uncharacterized protein LOC110034598 [Phalaenopsis equestris]